MSTNSRDRKHRGSPRQYCSCSSLLCFVLSFGMFASLSLLLFESHISALHSSAIFNWSTRRVLPVDIIISQTNDLMTITKDLSTNTKENSLPMQPYHKNIGSTELHFIHIPKCGGTSMTAILREVACKADPIGNVDCCTNPGKI